MSGRILVAEDDPVLAEILRFNLTKGGFDVVVAGDGITAAEHAAEERFDLIVSDHQMPGMTGYEFCRKVRNESPNAETPIYFCSAKGYELDTERLREELQITRILLKPFSSRELVESIRETIAAVPHEE